MRRLLVSLLLASSLLVLLPASGSAKTVWLCKPGASPDPCTGDLTASVVDANGNTVRTETTKVPKNPPIDCFYVYPTVSGQSTVNANLHVDPEETAIAEYQAQRFSQDCRVFAPMYRQVTLQGILNPKNVTAKARATAYNGVLAAWHEYLRKYNHGRGVVLIGHSQGSFALRALMTNEIDKKPFVRNLLVSALLMGGNVTVKKGKKIGGDFQNIPACTRGTQTGCVVAYSMFNATPPANSLFGRTTNPKQQVLCTDPAELATGKRVLHPYSFAKPFPGTLGIAVNAFTGPLPSVQTPWLIPPGTYTAHCSRAGGASVLMVTASNGARNFTPSPDAGWGWHLADVNLALGDLTTLVAKQAKAWMTGPRLTSKRKP